jgi:hypothetical protein
MIEEITKKLKSIALLEAIICPEWEYRFYSYNSKWGEGEEMASMRNGSGDEWFLWLKHDLAALKVLNHESGTLSKVDVIKDQFPSDYNEFISEPAFSINESSSLRYLNKNEWVKFDINEEKTNQLIRVFNWSPTEYKEWAEDYYEEEFPLEAIENIMSGILSESDIRSLNSDLTLKDIEEEINEIGYSR